MGRPTTWTKVQNDDARERWLNGERATDIGRAVGKTKNAVIGRANRCGWPLHPYGHDPRRNA